MDMNIGSKHILYASLFILLHLHTTLCARNNDAREKYKTAYACEGSQLEITCSENSQIHLIRANFGRFSISICNDNGHLDWSVNCVSRNSFKVINEICGMKKTCIIPASSDYFGNPCPGTWKYLEAHYECISESTSNVSDVGLSSYSESIKHNQAWFFGGRINTSMASTPTSESVTLFMGNQLTTRPPIIVPLTPLNKGTIGTAVSLQTSSSTSSTSSSTSTIVIPTSTIETPTTAGSMSTKNSLTTSSWKKVNNSIISSTTIITSTTKSISTSASPTMTSPTMTTASPRTSLQPPYLLSPSLPRKSEKNGGHDNRERKKENDFVVEDDTNVAVIVCVSCMVSLVFLCLTFSLLIFSRVKCDRLTIYKNICLNLISCEVLLGMIAYRPTSLEQQQLFASIIAGALHYILLAIFLWILMEAIRCYCCDMDFASYFLCWKRITISSSKPWTTALCTAYAVSYGVPLLMVTVTSIIYPHVYKKGFLKYHNWINFDALGWTLSVLLFAPAVLAIILSIVFFIMMLLVQDNKSEVPGSIGSQDKTFRRYSSTSVCFLAIFVMVSQTIAWTLANLYLNQAPTSVPLSISFASFNIIQSLILFTVCFAKNDKVRGSIQKSLSNLQWLPECVRTGKSPTLTQATAQTTYFYSLDATQLNSPPSPIIRPTSLHHHHMHHDHPPPSPPPTSSIHHQELKLIQTPNSRYIDDVNPYAPPVPVPFHEYEDISSALSERNYGFHRHHLPSHHQHHQLNNISHPSTNQEELYHYDHYMHPPQNTPDYMRTQSGFYFHNTRSPIYYSEGTHR